MKYFENVLNFYSKDINDNEAWSFYRNLQGLRCDRYHNFLK